MRILKNWGVVLGVSGILSCALEEDSGRQDRVRESASALTIKQDVCLSAGDYEYDTNAWLEPTLPAGMAYEPPSAVIGSTSHSQATTRGVLADSYASQLSDAQEAKLEFVYLAKVADADAVNLTTNTKRWQVALKLRANDAAGATVVYATWRFRELIGTTEEGPSVAIQVKRAGAYYNPTNYRVTQDLAGSPIEAPVVTPSISHVNALRAQLVGQHLKVWTKRYGQLEQLVWDASIDTGAASPGAQFLGLAGFRTDNVATRVRLYGYVNGDTHSYQGTRRSCADYHAEVPSL